VNHDFQSELCGSYFCDVDHFFCTSLKRRLLTTEKRISSYSGSRNPSASCLYFKVSAMASFGNAGTASSASSSCRRNDDSPCSPRPAESGSTSAASSSVLPRLLLLSALLPFSVRADDWHTGRATFYGYDGGASIDQGSCMYGPLPNYMVSTGRNIGALSD
ncbi:hypothetical protein VaNZ11_012469, partial [Volvox africanus]